MPSRDLVAISGRRTQAPRLHVGAGTRGVALALAFALLTLAARPAAAQPYARFAVPDSALAGAVRANGAQFETAWNALLVTELRASLARQDSAARLLALARRVAGAERSALGSRIATDALRLRAGWSAAQRRLRIAAAVDESLGAAAQAVQDYPRADSLFGSALRAYRRLGESRRVAWVWGSLGSLAFVRGDMAGADSLYRHALAARRAIGDLRMVGNALNTLGSIAYNLGRFGEARGYYEEARAVRLQIDERAALGTTLGLLANVAVAQGRADSAAVYFQAALDLTVALGDSARAHEVMNNYGVLLKGGRDPTSARPLFERALAIRRQRGDLAGQAEVQNNIGDLDRLLGHFADAIARLEEARELALAANVVRTLRDVLVTLGRAWNGLGDPAGAVAPLERALALSDSLGDPAGRAQALNNLSIAAHLADDASGSARFAGQALASASAAGDSSLVHEVATTLGEQAFDRGDLGEAHGWFSRALAAGTREADLYARALLNLGAVAARQERLEEADRHFSSALALADSLGATDVVWPALLGRGDVAERRGDHAEALRFDRQATAMIESLRAGQGSERPSMRLLARRLYAFEALIHLLARLQPQYPDSGFAAEAFLWSERARARSFLDLVAASGGEGRPVRPLTLAEAQARLPSRRAALLAYSVGDSSTSLWIVTRRAWRHVTLPSRRALRARVEILRHGLADPATADGQAAWSAARSLYRALIEPALPMLHGIEHLIVAPDDILARVPFEALLADDGRGDGAPGERPPRRGAYLVERYAISYAPSASALATRAGRGSATGIVALGNPTFATDTGVTTMGAAGGPKLPPLPYTAAEVAALTTLAGGRPVVALTGSDATRDRLLGLADLPRAALIHVATHGEANEVEPERSGIWTAAEEGGSAPGFITLADILGLEIAADVVTLSACETGLGRLERGEGVVGLTRAFLAAGAKSVLVSLWKVNDRSTARLMEQFYRRLLREDAPAAQALARAKRAMLAQADTRAPFYWAPFVLVGSAGRLGE